MDNILGYLFCLTFCNLFLITSFLAVEMNIAIFYSYIVNMNWYFGGLPFGNSMSYYMIIHYVIRLSDFFRLFLSTLFTMTIEINISIYFNYDMALSII